MPMPGNRRLMPEALEGRSYALGEAGRVVSRKELAGACREAEKALELSPTLRLVLSELVGVWGEQDTADGRLIVWPSNNYLVERTGLSERAVRYAMGKLTELMLLTPRDSANGKRFAVRRNGQLLDAYGFDLTPLYARRAEFAELLGRRRDSDERRRRLFDEITICRRASEEAMEGILGLSGSADRSLVAALDELRARTPRRGSRTAIDGLVETWRQMRHAFETAYYQAANAGKDCRHEETNNGTPSESCPTAPEERAGAPAVPATLDPPSHPAIQLVVEACPALTEYGSPKSEAELVALARFLRGSLGAHPSAWDEATDLIGPVRAAATIALVLQLHVDDVASGAHHIKNPGGYFRAMVRMVAERRIHLETEMLSLIRRRRNGAGPGN